MCTGVEIALVASAVASAGGAYMNSEKQKDNAQDKINARNQAAAQEIERQKQYQSANDASVGKAVTDVGNSVNPQNFGDLVTKREDAYTANAAPTPSFDAVSDGAPDVVKTDLAKRTADELAKSKTSAKALAKIGANTDVFQNNGLSINNAANQIGTTNNLARGSLDVNKVEQQAAANNVGNGTSTFGDLLQAAGAAGSVATGVGAFGPVAGAFGTGAGAASGAGATAAAGGFQAPVQYAATNPIVYNNATYAAAPVGAVW